MTFLLNHCNSDRIASDFELSERLGAEILAAGCEPVRAEHTERKGGCMVLVPRTNLVTGATWMEWVYV